MNEFAYRSGDSHLPYAASIADGTVLVLPHGGGPDHHSLLRRPRVGSFGEHAAVPAFAGPATDDCRALSGTKT
jgi:hypothetical protein